MGSWGLSMSGERRMLVSVAHPDDESFGMADTIAHYTGQGVGVYLICATNGDLGTVDPEHMAGYNTVAERRLAELHCAAQTLGISRVYTFGYRDSGMPGSPDNEHPDCLAVADPEKVAERITAVIREVRPQVVVTFDPYGGYGHPDHLAMHHATVRAFEAAGDPAQYPEQIEAGLPPYRPQKLYYMTFDRRFLRLMVRFLPLLGQDPSKFGRNKDINLLEIAAHSYPIHARIRNRTRAGLARQARWCHASQLGGVGPRQGIGQMIRDWLFGGADTYMRAYPPIENGRVQERDLFEGVRME